MKTHEDLIIREIVGEHVLVPVGELSQHINGMIHLSDTGAFIWNLYNEKNSLDEIVVALMNEYEVDEETAKTDVYGFTEAMYMEHLIMDIPEFEKDK